MMNKCKLGIMQPYFFPYIGYFQLINAVDKYVVYDDVNYIKRGWANRNYILVNGLSYRFSMAVYNPSQNKKFIETEISSDMNWRTKLLKTIEMSYHKAPYFNQAYQVVEKSLLNSEKNLGIYLFDSLRLLCNYMNINTELILSSSIEKDNSLKAVEKIYEICRLMGAEEYYNSVGGKELYNRGEFEKRNIKLYFLKLNDDFRYKQFDKEFIPNLSIIDVIMFNDVEQIQKLLTQYTLL